MGVSSSMKGKTPKDEFVSEIITRFTALRVIPVAVVEQADDVLPLAETLVEGQLPCLEIVLRSDAAVDAIRNISRRSDILVGAGTVLTIDQVKTAVDAGAQFMVSPGFNPTVASYCLDHRIPHIPGVCTPTEIEAGLELGLEVFKFFPAETSGGINALSAISEPYPQVQFIPTGGINAGNLADYLRHSKVLACGGTWIAGSDMIRSGRFDDILRNVRQASDIAKECETMR